MSRGKQLGGQEQSQCLFVAGEADEEEREEERANITSGRRPSPLVFATIAFSPCILRSGSRRGGRSSGMWRSSSQTLDERLGSRAFLLDQRRHHGEVNDVENLSNWIPEEVSSRGQ